jgi:hypothetical protein
MSSDASVFAFNIMARTAEFGMPFQCAFFDCEGYWNLMICEFPVKPGANRWIKSYNDLIDAANEVEYLGILTPELAGRMRANPNPIEREYAFEGRIKNPKEALRTFHLFPCTMLV